MNFSYYQRAKFMWGNMDNLYFLSFTNTGIVQVTEIYSSVCISQRPLKDAAVMFNLQFLNYYQVVI